MWEEEEVRKGGGRRGIQQLRTDLVGIAYTRRCVLVLFRGMGMCSHFHGLEEGRCSLPVSGPPPPPPTPPPSALKTHARMRRGREDRLTSLAKLGRRRSRLWLVTPKLYRRRGERAWKTMSYLTFSGRAAADILGLRFSFFPFPLHVSSFIWGDFYCLGRSVLGAMERGICRIYYWCHASRQATVSIDEEEEEAQFSISPAIYGAVNTPLLPT